MTHKGDRLAFRDPIQRQGYAMVYHVLTLDANLSDGAFRLYVLLLKYAQQKAACWPGRERLAADLGVSTQTIERRLAELVERGLITREQRGFGNTAMTWIESLAEVYTDEAVDNFISVKSEEASLLKNEEALAPSKMRGKEEQEEEQTNDDDDDTYKQSLSILTEAGADVTRTVKAVARTRTPDDVEAMLEAARGKPGLTNPLGWAIAQLRDGEKPPRIEEHGNGKDRIAATCPVCYRVMPIGMICEDCGRCLECCEC